MSEFEPKVWLDRPSTTSAEPEPKMGRSSARKRARRRQASPLPGMRLYGLACPVSVTFTVRTSAEVWIEVSNAHGRFYVNHDASVLDLIRQVQRGGHWIEDNPSTTRNARRGNGKRAVKDD